MSTGLSIKDMGANNRVSGKPAVAVRSTISFTGENAQVVFGRSVRCFDIRLNLGSNARVLVGDESLLRGSFTVAEATALTLGNRVVCNWPVTVNAAEGASIDIGNDCLFSDVAIYSSDLHSIIDLETGNRINKAEPVVIEDRVWLARRVIVLKGARIGYGAGIGSGAVVIGKIPRNSIAAGAPARVVRTNATWMREKLAGLEAPDLERYLSEFAGYEALHGAF